MKPGQLAFTYDGSVQNITVFDRKLSKKEISYLCGGKEIFPSNIDIVKIKNKFKFKQLFCWHEYGPLTLTWHENGEFKLQTYKECLKCGKIKKGKR